MYAVNGYLIYLISRTDSYGCLCGQIVKGTLIKLLVIQVALNMRLDWFTCYYNEEECLLVFPEGLEMQHPSGFVSVTYADHNTHISTAGTMIIKYSTEYLQYSCHSLQF